MPGDLDVDRALESILSPLLQLRDEIDQELAVVEARRTELRKARKKVTRQLSASEDKPKRRSRGRTQAPAVGGKVVDDIADYIKTKHPSGEFNSPQLRKEHDFGVTAQAMNRALTVLHERGVIRLVRQGGEPGYQGRVKVWEATTNAKPQRQD